MIKFILVLKVCYAVAQFCGPGIESTVTYDSFYDCGVAGYKYAGEIIESLPPEQVNQTQTFIKFYCFEKPKEELTPSSKIEKGV